MDTITNKYHQEVLYRLYHTLLEKGKVSQPAQLVDFIYNVFPEYREHPREAFTQDLKNLLLT